MESNYLIRLKFDLPLLCNCLLTYTVKTMESLPNNICGLKIRTACTIAGVIYLVLTVLTLLYYILELTHTFSRGCLINIAFHLILIFPTLPFFVGVYMQFNELILPYIFAIVFSVFNNIVWIAVIIIVHNKVLDPRQDVFKISYNYWLFVVISVLRSVVLIYILSITVRYFRYIYRINIAALYDVSEKTYYPYTRYGKKFKFFFYSV